jgi:hypothetical protein
MRGSSRLAWRKAPVITRVNSFRSLLALSVAYCVASLVHFVHNAEFLALYPNMPAWLSRSRVYAAWFAITAIGALGLVAARSRFALVGFVLLAIYAALGFDGLGHYALAPVSSHTLAMNLTIWFEVVAAAVLLAFTLRCVLRAGSQFGSRRAGA